MAVFFFCHVWWSEALSGVVHFASFSLILVLQDIRAIDLIIARGASAGVVVSSALARRLAAYVSLLAKWNRKINLTSLAVDPLTDAATDRLIVEPLVAARHVGLDDRSCLDVGSGGGSPALPLALACPGLTVTLVESRVRKAAFLREAIRHLAMSQVSVENCRMEELAHRFDLSGRLDLVTMRAVRPDVGLLLGLGRLLRPRGRLFFFGAVDLMGVPHLGVERVRLVGGGELSIIDTFGTSGDLR